MNEQLLNQLKSGTLAGDIYAKLINEQGSTLFEFLFNPEEKQYSSQAKYTETPTALTKLPNYNYNYTTGLTLTLPNLILVSHSRGKTLTNLFNSLRELMVADIANKRYEPLRVKFVWGSDTFGSAVITDISWVENEWLSGEVAGARLNMTLLQVPSTLINNPDTFKSKLNDASKKKTLLTDRQKQEASTKANKWLTDNIKKIKNPLTSIIKAKKYKLLTSNDGVVTMLNTKNNLIGTIGTYRGTTLDTSKNTISK